MSVEANKAAVRRFTEAMSRGDLSGVDEFVSDDVRYHSAPPGLPPGKAGYRAMMAMYLAAFPDLQLTVEELVGEGDFVTARLRGRGTHRGAFMDIAPTGRTADAQAVSMMRFQQGKLCDEWEQIDMLGLLAQLGASPVPASAPA